MNRALLRNLIVPQLFNKFHVFYGTPKFLTAFTCFFFREQDLSNSWIRSISLRSILLLYFHLCLGVPGSPFYFRFSAKNKYKPFVYTLHATSPTLLTLLVLISRIIFGEDCASRSWSLNAEIAEKNFAFGLFLLMKVILV